MRRETQCTTGGRAAADSTRQDRHDRITIAPRQPCRRTILGGRCPPPEIPRLHRLQPPQHRGGRARVLAAGRLPHRQGPGRPADPAGRGPGGAEANLPRPVRVRRRRCAVGTNHRGAGRIGGADRAGLARCRAKPVRERGSAVVPPPPSGPADHPRDRRRCARRRHRNAVRARPAVRAGRRRRGHQRTGRGPARRRRTQRRRRAPPGLRQDRRRPDRPAHGRRVPARPARAPAAGAAACRAGRGHGGAGHGRRLLLSARAPAAANHHREPADDGRDRGAGPPLPADRRGTGRHGTRLGRGPESGDHRDRPGRGDRPALRRGAGIAQTGQAGAGRTAAARGGGGDGSPPPERCEAGGRGIPQPRCHRRPGRSETGAGSLREGGGAGSGQRRWPDLGRVASTGVRAPPCGGTELHAPAGAHPDRIDARGEECGVLGTARPWRHRGRAGPAGCGAGGLP